MKKRSIIALTLTGFLLSGTAYAAVNGMYKGYKIVNVKVDGNTIVGDVPAVLLDDRTMVPLRFVSEAMGGSVSWDEKTQTASVTSKPSTNYTLLTKQDEFHQASPKIDVYYPEFTGLADKTVQQKINDTLKSAAMLDTNTTAFQYLQSYYCDYSIAYQKGNIVSIVFDSYVDTGGAHGMPNKFTLNINLATGETYQLKDFLNLNSDAYSKLTDLIKKKDHDHTLDTFGPWEGFNEKTGYDMNLEYGGIAIKFPPYEFASFAQGFLTYHLSWNELQQLGILNKDGAAWKSLGLGN
jgi:hypothetical protein